MQWAFANEHLVGTVNSGNLCPTKVQALGWGWGGFGESFWLRPWLWAVRGAEASPSPWWVSRVPAPDLRGPPGAGGWAQCDAWAGGGWDGEEKVLWSLKNGFLLCSRWGWNFMFSPLHANALILPDQTPTNSQETEVGGRGTARSPIQCVVL